MASKKRHRTTSHILRIAEDFCAENWMRFVEIPYFRKKWLSLDLNDDDLRALQICLTASPASFPVVAGTGGLRKARFSKVDSNRGKSGSYRIGFVYFEEFGVIGLIAVYAKNDQSTIPVTQKTQIKDAIEKLRKRVAEH